MLSRLAKQTLLGQRKLPFFVYQSSASSGSDSQVSKTPASEEAPGPAFIDIFKAECTTTQRIADVKDISKVVSSEVSDEVPRPTPFNSPLRDHVNFPKPVRLLHPSKTRIGFIPEEWFKFFYHKTGVTGPYALGIGVSLFLVNKEIFLIDDFEFQHLIAFIMWMYVLTKSSLGTKILEFLRKGDSDNDEKLLKFRRYNEEVRVQAIAHEKEEQWRGEGKFLLLDAKKENVGLQLEAAYREGVMDLYQKVKRRLDYQVEVAKIDSRIKQQFMVNWVIERVKESVSQASEKDNLKQCIANLNILASKV